MIVTLDLYFLNGLYKKDQDNPNVMTLCKLALVILKYLNTQQIGRGLRLAVNQDGKKNYKKKKKKKMIVILIL